jgi:hypothetical protein
LSTGMFLHNVQNNQACHAAAQQSVTKDSRRDDRLLDGG